MLQGVSDNVWLNIHRKSKHENGFNYECNICHKGFNQAIQYHSHCANHLNIVLEKCSVCVTEFRSPGCLKKHLNVCKHNLNRSDEAKYVWAVCSASFSTKHGLDGHRRRKHQPFRYLCAECKLAFGWRSSF